MKLGFFDTETGGLNFCGNIALLSIGAVCGDSQFEGYIDPDLSRLRIEHEAARVNGWPEAFEGKDKYPEKDVNQAFLHWVASNGITHLVAHNAPFDNGFIVAAATRSGLWTRGAIPRMLCTQSMAHILKQLGLLNTPALSLNAVAKALGFPDDRNKQHDALEDAILCEKVYNALAGINAAPAQSPAQQQPRNGLAFRRLGR